MRRLALVVSLAVAAPLAAQNWPGFRGPNGSGVGNGSGPTTWNAEKGANIAWKTPIPGLGHSSPVVWGDRIYVTTAVPLNAGADQSVRFGDQMEQANDLVPHSWRVYALDRKSGKIIWQTATHEGTPRGKRHVKSSYANPTPVTDGRSIVVSFSDGTLACLDRNGKLIWKQSFEVPQNLKADEGLNEITTSPILFKNLVIYLHDFVPNAYLAAYELSSGKEVWKVTRDEANTWSTPTIVTANGKSVLVTNSWRHVRGHDPATGKELWRMKGRKGSWDRGPVPLQFGDLTIIAGGGPEQPLFAIRPTASGEIVNLVDQPRSEHIAWATDRGSPYIPSPVVFENHIYVLSDKGILSAYDVRDGRRVYQERVSPTAGGFSASPVAAGGKLYLASEDGEVYVIRAGPRFELLATNPMGEMCLATPAFAGDTLIVRTRSHIYAIGASATSASKRR